MTSLTSPAPAEHLPGPAAIERTIATASVPRHELAIHEAPERRFVNISVTREDKEAFDAVQAWYSFRAGRRVPHWELFNLVLADALDRQDGRFYRMAARSWV